MPFYIKNMTKTFLSVKPSGGEQTIAAGAVAGPFADDLMSEDILAKARRGLIVIDEAADTAPEPPEARQAPEIMESKPVNNRRKGNA